MVVAVAPEVVVSGRSGKGVRERERARGEEVRRWAPGASPAC